MQTHLSPEEKKLIGYKAESSLDENYAGHSYVKEILLTLFSNKGACIGLVCILIIVGFAIFAPMVSSYTYKEVHSDTTNLPMRIPGLEKLGIFDGTRKGVDVYASKGVKDQYHYFGTDALGRDIWTRVWEGTRISLLIAVLAVVLDVTFAPTPQCPPDTTCPLDAPATAYGPYVQHRLLERLKQTAKENGVTLNCEHTERSTGTDADDVQIARAGVPCVLLSLPVKYMHTSVELLDMNTLSECGRLLALFVAGIDEKWEDGLWN